jgi:16S rRNA (guanine(527)-N(7))-methyltransferase RsmG
MNANNQERTKPGDEFRAALEQALKDFQAEPLSDEQINQLVGHYTMMVEWNRHTNLTRITAPEAAARLHYAESIFGARFLGEARTVLDIGSGAGFPALPLAVASPHREVTALEANQKKTLFLHEAKDALQIANLKITRARVEDFQWRAYDLLTSRALDRAEEVMQALLNEMGAQQRLMLYCAPDMVARLKTRLPASFQIERHQIPSAESRILAVFSQQ